MHPAVFSAAVIALTASLCICVALVLRPGSRMARILALDTLTLVLAALLMLFALARRSALYLDAALALVLLGFVGTLLAARFASGRRLF